MSDWKITGKDTDLVDKVAEIATLGLCPAPTTYEVTNKSTGDVKHVSAFSEKGVAEKISDGNFMKK